MQAPANERFHQRSRLIKKVDFDLARKRGLRRKSHHLQLWVRRTSLPHPRLGLAVSRKVGKSHDRNLLKRRLREIFRRRLAGFEPGYDYVVVAREGAAGLDFEALKNELTTALNQAGRR